MITIRNMPGGTAGVRREEGGPAGGGIRQKWVTDCNKMRVSGKNCQIRGRKKGKTGLRNAALYWIYRELCTFSTKLSTIEGPRRIKAPDGFRRENPRRTTLRRRENGGQLKVDINAEKPGRRESPATAPARRRVPPRELRSAGSGCPGTWWRRRSGCCRPGRPPGIRSSPGSRSWRRCPRNRPEGQGRCGCPASPPPGPARRG